MPCPTRSTRGTRAHELGAGDRMLKKTPWDASSGCRTVWHHAYPQHSAGVLMGMGPCVPTSGGGAAWAARIAPVSPTSDRGIDHAVRLALRGTATVPGHQRRLEHA